MFEVCIFLNQRNPSDGGLRTQLIEQTLKAPGAIRRLFFWVRGGKTSATCRVIYTPRRVLSYSPQPFLPTAPSATSRLTSEDTRTEKSSARHGLGCGFFSPLKEGPPRPEAAVRDRCDASLDLRVNNNTPIRRPAPASEGSSQNPSCPATASSVSRLRNTAKHLRRTVAQASPIHSTGLYR